jgi:hypothetical protein
LTANRNWIVGLVVVMAMALVAGCGSSDDNSSTAPSTTSSSSGSSSSSSSTGNTPDDVYNACIDAISGTPAEAAGKPGCEAARTAFQKCSDQASNLPSSAKDKAVAACQKTADAAVAALKSAG